MPNRGFPTMERRGISISSFVEGPYRNDHRLFAVVLDVNRARDVEDRVTRDFELREFVRRADRSRCGDQHALFLRSTLAQAIDGRLDRLEVVLAAVDGRLVRIGVIDALVVLPDDDFWVSRRRVDVFGL